MKIPQNPTTPDSPDSPAAGPGKWRDQGDDPAMEAANSSIELWSWMLPIPNSLDQGINWY